MIDLETYKKIAVFMNLCEEYTEKWNGCNTKKKLVDMALGSKGMDYLCASIAQGWGLSPKYIVENFEPYINGKYISNQKGYTSKMFCCHLGNVSADTTAIVLIDSDVVLNVPQNALCEVYATGNSSIELKGEGKAVFICYGNPDDIKIMGDEKNYKRINKKDRDYYE